MYHDEAARPEGSSSDELSAIWRSLSRENEENQSLPLVRERVALEPEDRSPFLVAKTKRTPNGGQGNYLRLLLL